MTVNRLKVWQIEATGTRDATTYLAGDGSWGTPAGSGGGGGGGAFRGVKASINGSPAATAGVSTHTPIPLDTEAYDTDSLHSTTTNNSRVTIPTGLGGKWHVDVAARFDAVASAGVFQVSIAKNGVYTGGGEWTNNPEVLNEAIYMPGGTGKPVTLSASSDVMLAAGDYIELVVFQDSGNAVPILRAHLAAHLVEGGTSTTTTPLAPLTTSVGGTPDFVWDENDELVLTEVVL